MRSATASAAAFSNSTKAQPPELVAGLLRLAHTLKGAARVVRQPTVADHAHAIEEALAPVRESGGPVERDLTDRLLSLTDAISSEISKLDAPPATRPVETPSRAPVEDDLRMARLEVADLEVLLDSLAEATTQLRGLRRHATAVEKAGRLSDLLIDHIAPVPVAASAAPAGTSAAKLRSLAEELRTLIGGVERNLSDAIEQTDRELREVREAAERLRLIPISTLFTSLERVVRDTAPSLGKEATFSARGGDVRLEAAVLSLVQSALIQMVRNAVAHGVEPPNDRARIGKPRAGHVELDVTDAGTVSRSRAATMAVASTSMPSAALQSIAGCSRLTASRARRATSCDCCSKAASRRRERSPTPLVAASASTSSATRRSVSGATSP